MLIWVWQISWPEDHKGTKRLAEEESQSRSTDTGVLLSYVFATGIFAVAINLVTNLGQS